MKSKKCVTVILVLSAAAALCAFYLKAGCPIKWLTGVSCPGCGMSRAAAALLKCDFKTAFYYHPLIFFMPFFAAVFILQKHIPKKTVSAFALLFVLLMVSVYIYRMLSGSDIVCFNPQNGILCRLIRFLWRFLTGNAAIILR